MQPTDQTKTKAKTAAAKAKAAESEHARLQNDYGADYWVRNGQEHRRATGGRGLFAGLQDVKHYNVDHGWARRKSETEQPGILGSIWSRITGL
ncbi:hypothetical protein DTO013E5_5755 [Penicillium roqueforti]|uniref:Genomic scaffold, ProqFM164S02 n=1 Tax=Penicillium roqueforti (strain FM164) TaxID=1365484 RepID=W6Q9F6_PENRF|nr:uncharacterized protein LCP9604111_7903 [Penicillium roqueforti]XP_057046056.1 uncharacterized protein N7518_003679 [Penicillium psychrosexuale]CDM33050.1 unnamed protein product [Penicillium roqueforti FM164]KAF9242720.1 hypothetical protein LCP9604111_7903 [Penicillium roqueforti]KAI1830574.1 hypothetical protein CBS147337_8640 [Penicillium roqueforti]KAI2674342.1 hypothetical protein CBS147355_6956 [Penicillium roqueforti]KAI2684001.1 hypothetical protein LCP963914a_5831 [Penicillium ro